MIKIISTIIISHLFSGSAAFYAFTNQHRKVQRAHSVMTMYYTIMSMLQMMFIIKKSRGR